jgi:hypothetical protein
MSEQPDEPPIKISQRHNTDSDPRTAYGEERSLQRSLRAAFRRRLHGARDPSRHDVAIDREQGEYMLHDGTRARCSCGWSSDCYAQFNDAQRAIDVHLRRACP